MPKSATNEAECGGPKYDAPGVLSAACIACGKCEAVQRLIRELAPLARTNEAMRTANAAR